MTFNAASVFGRNEPLDPTDDAPDSTPIGLQALNAMWFRAVRALGQNYSDFIHRQLTSLPLEDSHDIELLVGK